MIYLTESEHTVVGMAILLLLFAINGRARVRHQLRSKIVTETLRTAGYRLSNLKYNNDHGRICEKIFVNKIIAMLRIILHMPQLSVDCASLKIHRNQSHQVEYCCETAHPEVHSNHGSLVRKSKTFAQLAKMRHANVRIPECIFPIQRQFQRCRYSNKAANNATISLIQNSVMKTHSCKGDKPF
ncbi:hypothetical protein T09_10858 [Trichinella sp. T9]|nr:hypothetical protein T09_10858 [Trichinella sp. T9]